MFKRMYAGILRFFLSPIIKSQERHNRIFSKDIDWQCGWNDRTLSRIGGINDRVVELENQVEKYEKLINGLADRLGLTIFGDGFIGKSAIDERSATQKLNEALEASDGFSVLDILRNELAPRTTKGEAQANSLNSGLAVCSGHSESSVAGA